VPTIRSAAAIVLVYGHPAFSQAPNEPPAFRSNVNLVTVPVVVRDRSGHSIGTLQKEDFQLFDKGKPQVISKFTIERSGAPDIATDSGGVASPPAAPPPVASRFVAYLFDDLHSSFTDLARAKTAALTHLAESMSPVDRVAVFTTSGQNAQDFTDDRDQLRETINRIAPRSRATHSGDCPNVSEYVADAIENRNDRTALEVVTRQVRVCRSGVNLSKNAAETMAREAARVVLNTADRDLQSSLEVLRNLATRMSAMPGQRTIVLVSGGFLVTAGHQKDESEVIDRAVRARVAIGTLDVRGLYAVVPGGDASVSGAGESAQAVLYQNQSARAEGDVLGELADGTGGTRFHNNSDLLEGFRRTSLPEVTYVLGFAPQDAKLDGSFHPLKVTTTVPDATVQTRRGYYAPRRSSDAAEMSQQETSAALFSRDQPSDIPVQLETQFAASDAKLVKLAVIVHVDLKPVRFQKTGDLNRATLDVSTALFDRNGILVTTTVKEFTLTLTDERLQVATAAGVALKVNFDVAPGMYAIRLVMHDSEGHTTARNHVVEIP
jgi:VWFA-related protein